MHDARAEQETAQADVAGPKNDAERLPDPLKGRKTIFLSWGGAIYGPASEAEITAGIRAASFEEDALYWHDGLEGWRYLRDFAPSGAASDSGSRLRPKPGAPPVPVKPKRRERSVSARKPRNAAPKTPSRRPGHRGRLVFFVIAFLAVLLTVGALLLLMKV